MYKRIWQTSTREITRWTLSSNKIITVQGMPPHSLLKLDPHMTGTEAVSCVKYLKPTCGFYASSEMKQNKLLACIAVLPKSCYLLIDNLMVDENLAECIQVLPRKSCLFIPANINTRKKEAMWHCIESLKPGSTLIITPDMNRLWVQQGITRLPEDCNLRFDPEMRQEEVLYFMSFLGRKRYLSIDDCMPRDVAQSSVKALLTGRGLIINSASPLVLAYLSVLPANINLRIDPDLPGTIYREISKTAQEIRSKAQAAPPLPLEGPAVPIIWVNSTTHLIIVFNDILKEEIFSRIKNLQEGHYLWIMPDVPIEKGCRLVTKLPPGAILMIHPQMSPDVAVRLIQAMPRFTEKKCCVSIHPEARRETMGRCINALEQNYSLRIDSTYELSLFQPIICLLRKKIEFSINPEVEVELPNTEYKRMMSLIHQSVAPSQAVATASYVSASQKIVTITGSMKQALAVATSRYLEKGQFLMLDPNILKENGEAIIRALPNYGRLIIHSDRLNDPVSRASSIAWVLALPKGCQLLIHFNVALNNALLLASALQPGRHFYIYCANPIMLDFLQILPESVSLKISSQISPDDLVKIKKIIEKKAPKPQTAAAVMAVTEEISCVICLENNNQRNAMVPCGHRILCEDCYLKSLSAPQLYKKCPLCQTPVTQIIKLF